MSIAQIDLHKVRRSGDWEHIEDVGRILVKLKISPPISFYIVCRNISYHSWLAKYNYALALSYNTNYNKCIIKEISKYRNRRLYINNRILKYILFSDRLFNARRLDCNLAKYIKQLQILKKY